MPADFTATDVQAALEADDEGKLIELLSDCFDDLYYNSGEAIADNLFAYIKGNADAVRIPSAR
jgi:hypothetical protein